MMVVRPKPIHDLLLNPGIGFTTFQRFNGDGGPEFLDCIDGSLPEYTFDGSLTNEAHPPTTMAYFRLLWSMVEPEQGEYRFDIIDHLLETAKARGQTLILRVAPTSGIRGNDRSKDAPSWYRNLIGDQPTVTKWWIVDHNDSRYEEHYGAMIRALGERYNGHLDLEAVDVSICGQAGEGMGSDLLEDDVRERLTNAYLEGFPKTQKIVLARNDEIEVYDLFRGEPAGWRLDCLGDLPFHGAWGESERDESGEDDEGWAPRAWAHMIDHYPMTIHRMKDEWQRSHVAFEVCWDIQRWWDRGYDVDHIIEQSLKWHLSSMNAKSRPIPEAWLPKMEDWICKMGYRLALRRFECLDYVKADRQMSVMTYWDNTGVAPCYRDVAFALRLRRGDASWTMLSEADVRTWLPGDAFTDETVQIPEEVERGDYLLDVGIVDRSSQEPVIKLAMEGRREDGWYEMGAVQVRV